MWAGGHLFICPSRSDCTVNRISITAGVLCGWHCCIGKLEAALDFATINTEGQVWLGKSCRRPQYLSYHR